MADAALPWIESVSIQDVGPIAKLSLTPPSTGIYEIVGANAFGKTQVLSAIACAIIERFDHVEYDDRGTGQPAIGVVVRDDDQAEEVIYRFNRSQGAPEGYRRLIAGSADGTDSPIDRLRSALNPNKGAFMIGPPPFEDIDIRFVMEELLDIIRPMHGRNSDQERIVQRMYSAGKGALSLGEVELLRTASSLIEANKAHQNPPVLFDSPLAMFSAELQEVVIYLLNQLALRTQVFIASTPRHAIGRPSFTLTAPKRERSPIGFSTEVDALVEDLRTTLRRESMLRAVNSQAIRSAVPGASITDVDLGAIALAIGRLQSDVDTIRTDVKKILAELTEIRIAFEENLRDAIQTGNEWLVEQLASELSERSTATYAHSNAPRLSELRRRLEDRYPEWWNHIGPYAQRDLAVAQCLSDERSLDLLPFALLAICRAVEDETNRQIFHPFRHVNADTNLSEESRSAEVKSDLKTSRKILCDFLDGLSPGINLGSVGHVMRWAWKTNDPRVFEALRSFITDKYGDNTDELVTLLKSISFGGGALDNYLPRGLADIRNRCAHPPGVTDTSDIFSDGTFGSLWNVATEPPIQALAILGRGSATSNH